MQSRTTVYAAAVLVPLVVAAAAPAAEKGKTKPYPHYWMSISTSNQSIPGMDESMSGMMGMFGGAGFGPKRELLLQLESPRTLSVVPEAAHEIPAAMNMGASLPLITPRVEKGTRETPPQRYEKPEQMEQPKGRMLIYWGCGDKVRAGQPVVFDAAKMKPQEMGRIFKSRQATLQTPPAMHNGWTYGEWPAVEEQKPVPKDSTLVGDHLIKGNYVPDIRFTLDKQRDFMAPVQFTSVQQTPGEATAVEWKPVPTAIGYFASAMGQNGAGDMVFWSSSEVQEMGSGLMDYLTPGDVSRFIKEKVVMDATQTSCTVPPVFKGSQGAMLQFIGYGEQLDLIHPPRPKDPKQPWNPQWSVKVRLKSTAMTPLGMESSGAYERKGASGKAKKRGQRQEQQPVRQQESQDTQEKPDTGGAIGDALRGILGF